MNETIHSPTSTPTKQTLSKSFDQSNSIFMDSFQIYPKIFCKIFQGYEHLMVFVVFNLKLMF